MNNLQMLLSTIMQMGYKSVRIEAVDKDGKKHSLEYNQHSLNAKPERALRVPGPGLE